MEPITTRLADLDAAADRDAVLHLLDTYARGPMGLGEPLPEPTRRRTIAGLKSHPTSAVYLAAVGDRPVGLAVCFVGFSTFAGRPLLNVHDLIVEPDYRRRGIGRKLLEQIEADAQRRGCCKLTLEVRQDNTPAKSLYRRHGFLAAQPDNGQPDKGQPVHEFWTKPF